MAIAVYAADDEFEVLRSGLPTSGDRGILRDRMESVARSFGLVGSDIFNRAKGRFDNFDFDRIERKFDGFKRMVTHAFDIDEIRPMRTIGQFQQAGPIQARWLYANPRVKRLHEREMIDGWSGYKFNRHEGRYGDDDPDYQQVMQGLEVCNEEGHSHFVEWLHLYDDDYRTELTFSQQTTIRNSMWVNFESFLDEGLDDPSDPHNGSL